MLRKILTIKGIFFCFSLSFAQNLSIKDTLAVVPTETIAPLPGSDKWLTISGSADIYYRYDLGQQVSNNKTSFTGVHDQFALGMASVKLEHSGQKVGFVADFGIGNRAKEFSYTDKGITQSIKQLYITYLPVSWCKLTAGTWATHVGYELLDPNLNRNYSMSYMFTNGPFSHTGLKAEIGKGKHSFMAGISNPTDYRSPPKNQMNHKLLLVQYGFAASDQLKLYLNLVSGKGVDTALVHQLDAVINATISEKVSLGFNGTINRTKPWNGEEETEFKQWWGSAIYINIDPASWFGFSLRSEWFNDTDSIKGLGTSIFANTLSINIKTAEFTFIPEFRFEKANEAIFPGNDVEPESQTSAFLLAAVYHF